MKSLPLLASALVGGVVVIGCVKDDSSNASTPGGNESGSDTTIQSSPGSGSESNATSGSNGAPTSDGEITDSISTLATTVNPTTDGCGSRVCDDVQHMADECDNWAQDCPDGQKCAAYSTDGETYWNANKCVDVTGMDHPGDPCTSSLDPTSGSDSCIRGAMCWNVDREGVGTCFALCTGTPATPACEQPLATCFDSGAINLCHPFCNPLLQDCSGAQACLPVNDLFTCTVGDEGHANDACEGDFACAPGLLCREAAFVGIGCNTDFCCTSFCEFPDGACPNPDQKCLQYYDAMNLPDPGLANIGTCGVSS